ncbi:bifunctional mannitol-1-phosphate dehydrogenase/phosphatase [Corticibacter populi]|uniref:bifunctional mannitol-1-phosphate dehydrogenase/phosphatase n=1 Tax=Corticibacter populi TaxID=1550736 RepID=UPI001B86EEE8|nr:HAD family hydrolase [Corticibacter populi]
MFFKDKHIRAAIFDMDGTMFDTERLRFSTLRKASLQLFGQSISDEVLYGSLGLSAKKAQELAQQHFGPRYPYQAIRRRADELELAYVRKYGVPVKKGLYDVLERLKRNGVLLALATSTRRAIAEEYLLSAKVLKYFDATVCGDEVIHGKPAPEIFLTAASEINCAPEECLILEDSANGLKAAVAAGGLPIYLLDIKHPPAAIRKKAFAGYDSMLGFLQDLQQVTPHLPLPRLSDAFPPTQNHSIAGIHGFGAIGGGYLSQIFSHWDGYARPRKIIGVTGNALYRGIINHFGKYRVRYPDVAFDQSIENVEIVDSGDEAAICQMYVDAEIIGICLPETAIRSQAPLIGRALAQRQRDKPRRLAVLVLINKVGGADFVRKAVAEALAEQLGASSAGAVLKEVDFVETVVNRIVTKIPRETVFKLIRASLGNFERSAGAQTIDLGPPVRQLLGQKAATTETALPQLYEKMSRLSNLTTAINQVNVALFHSGPDMPLYVQKGPDILGRLCQLKVVDDIAQIQTIKNKLLNGTHVILAWYASLLGYETIAQGMGDERVATLVRRLVNQEIKPAIVRESPELAEHVNSFMNNFLQRCRSSFKDPCRRVGRDPLRKLQQGERIMGSIALAERHGIATPMLEYGVALGLLYAIRRAAPSDKESQQIKARYEAGESVARLLCWQGSYHGKPYRGLSPERDMALIRRISRHFGKLLQADSPHWSWPLRRS